MPKFSLNSSLSASADPMLLVSGDGRVLWFNTQAKQLSKRESVGWPLSEWFEDPSVRAVLGTTMPHSISVEYRKPLPSRSLSTATVLDVGSGGPGNELFLVLLTPGRSAKKDGSAEEQFLTTLSHDLKNPLGAIFGYSDALLDTVVGDGMLPQQREIVSRVRATASRCLELVRNAQHIAYLESQGFRHSPEVIDINVAVRSVLDYTWRDERASPSLFVQLCPEPLRVRIERTEFDRVVVNLLSNALKYTPATGRITIRSKIVGDSAVVEFHNSEPAIPKEELPALFSKFVRGSTSTGVAGSGLGLYIVKLIVEGSGGEVQAKSSEQLGTTFSFSLPRVVQYTELPRG